MSALARFIATVAYSGYAPIAPGTVGSGVALLLLAVIRWSDVQWLEPGVLLLVLVGGTWAADRVEREARREDPGIVVVDEVAGMLLTLVFFPFTWLTGLVGFLAFRVFDIIKPFPAGRSERLPGGIGIMADDLIAGLYAAGVVWASQRALSLWP